MYWYNGSVIEKDTLSISMTDHGLLYGHGSSETFRTYNGKVAFLDFHYTRLTETLAALQIAFPYTLQHIEDGVASLWQALHCRDQLFRLIVTAGELDNSYYAKPNVWIVVEPLPTGLRGEERKGHWSTVPFVRRAVPLVSRGFHYSDYIVAQMKGNLLRSEALLLNERGIITEGIHSNIFWSNNDILFTPSLDTGIVRGITREIILQIANEMGLQVYEGEFTQDDFIEARECFLTNAVEELIPLVQVGDKPLAGNEGILYNELHRAYVYTMNK